MEVSENSKVTLDLKTIGMIIGFVISLSSMYFVLKSDIALAMTLPEPEVSKTEYELKDKIIREAVLTTQEDVKEIKSTLEKLEVRIYELKK
ncbi:MAG: hypothetical protein Tp139SUR343261_9 [Prokaryotic dsDNA virus sp.]|jgi:hypothetical protein|nr:MAG: hypothetical protein Tp139SUR343261_9 [Prokaryotic dsDNA virus sp.]|tara:strand:+ start:479 stop:751 length:273 start_codon:yes stop_codon:yes gene_type:complete